MQRGVEIQHTVERGWVMNGRGYASFGTDVTDFDETWRIWKVHLMIYLMVLVVFYRFNLARSRHDLDAIWGRGAISARSRRDLGTRPLHEDYVSTEFASNAVHMHKVSSKFVKMAPNDDTRGVGGRGHQEGTLNTPRPISFCSSPLTSLSSQLIGMVEWWWWW